MGMNYMKSHVTVPKSFIKKFYSEDKQLYRLRMEDEEIEKITTIQDEIFTIEDYFSPETEKRISLEIERVFGNLRGLITKVNLENFDKRDDKVFRNIDRALILQFTRIEGVFEAIRKKSIFASIFHFDDNKIMTHILDNTPNFKEVFRNSRKGILVNDSDISFVLGKDLFSNFLLNGETGFIMPFSPKIAFIIFSEKHEYVRDNRSKEQIEQDLSENILENINIIHQEKIEVINYVNLQILFSEIISSKRTSNRYLIGEKTLLNSLKIKIPKGKFLVKNMDNSDVKR